MNTLVNATSAVKASCPMIMVFHGGHCERILWRSWVASTYVEFTFSCLAFVVMGFLYEALKFSRHQLNKRASRKYTERTTLSLQLNLSNGGTSGSIGGATGSRLALADSGLTSKTYCQYIITSTHIATTLLFFVQVALSYLLMQVFMNYNYWLCLSVVVGLSFGYFVFGWSQHDAYDNDCCH